MHPAESVDVYLDLQFNNPNDNGSGGIWTVSALADDAGLAGLVFEISPVNFTGDFLISDTVFEVQLFQELNSFEFEIVTGDDLQTPTLGVGVGSAAGIATGTFDPGNIPALTSAAANIFDPPSGSSGSAAIVTTSLTTNLVPEPTAIALLGLSLACCATVRRR